MRIQPSLYLFYRIIYTFYLSACFLQLFDYICTKPYRMNRIVHVNTVADFDRIWGVESRHPLINVVEGERISTPVAHCRKHFNLYVIYIKDAVCADSITYGRGKYDYQENTLVFVAPGQVLGHPADGSTFKAMGWCLYFSPELLRGTSLAGRMRDYSFFSYSNNEALHISAGERSHIIDCLHKIDEEISRSTDRHSNRIIASAIELLLNYCARFYERQFESRATVNKDIITAFEEIVDNYYSSGKAAEQGVLTVNRCADMLHLSPNYFGDLIRKETGKSPKEHIQAKILLAAKEMLWKTGMSVSEIAYALGYQYPQYFSRSFKTATGMTPKEYRDRNK